ncbi:hypothetical protein HNP48_001754 [Acidovorax soli]|uniref:Uncharacterized protein n=1 Tax=Acidovorax soli TaxID=592050 RepID=A0A7X0PBX4_9BURK|nr:hypothetical protein [Acidovorax soli]
MPNVERPLSPPATGLLLAGAAMARKPVVC